MRFATLCAEKKSEKGCGPYVCVMSKVKKIAQIKKKEIRNKGYHYFLFHSLFFTKFIHAAALAHRLSRGADGSAVEDDTVTEIIALFRWQKSAQDQLDLLLIGLVVQPQSSCDTYTVCVYDDSALHAEDVAHHEVCGLSADARQGDQGF